MNKRPAEEPRAGATQVIAIALYAQLMTSGLTSYGVGVFLKPVAEEFGGSRFAVSLGPTLYTIASSLASPLIGRMIDRWGVRPVMTAGGIWLGIGLAAIAAAGALWHIAVLLVVGMAVGATLAGSLPANALIVRRFAEAPAWALGIASTGTSLGGVLIPPIAAALLLSFGWRGSVFALGAASLLTLAPLAWLLVPAQGSRARDVVPVEGDTDPADDRSALRERSFWLIAAALGLLYSTNTALVVHLVPYATDIGIGPQRAALLVSLLALGSVAGKLAYSAFGDRFDVRAPLWLAAVLQALSMALVLAWPRFEILIVVAAANGLGTGAVLPAWSALIARCFGARRFGEVMGWMRPFMYPVMNVGLLMAGRIKDVTDSYALAWQVFAASAIVAGVLPFWLRIPALPDTAPAPQLAPRRV